MYAFIIFSCYQTYVSNSHITVSSQDIKLSFNADFWNSDYVDFS